MEKSRAGSVPFWAVLALVVGLGLALAAPALRLGLFIDEPSTANVAHMSWTGMWAQLYRDVGDPLIYVLLNLWTRVAGESPLALRAPAMIFFALTIWVTGQLARRLGGAWAGVVAALLVAVSINLGLTYAAQARPYELLALCAAASTYLVCALLELFGPPRHRLLLEAALAGVYLIGVLAHPVFVFYALALTLAGLWRSPMHFARLAAAGAAAGAVYLLLMFPLLKAVLPLPATAWIQRPHWRDLPAGVWQLWSQLSAGILIAALLILLLARTGQARSLLRQTAARVLVTLIGFTFASVLAVSLVKPIYYAPRTPILWLPASSVLAALVLTRLDPRRWITRLTLAGMLGRAVAAAAVIWANPQPAPAQAAIDVIAPELRCGDRIVAGGLAYDEVVYSLRQDGFEGCLQISTFPADTILHAGWLVLPPSEAVAAQAAQTAATLKAEPDVPLWFFYDSRRAQAANDALKAELDRSLGQPQEQPLATVGWRFDRVFVYFPRRQTGLTYFPARHARQTR